MVSGNKTEQRIAELQSEDVKVRKDAALWLGHHGVQEACVPLLAALQDSSWKVRRNAAIALGQVGNGDAVEPLIAALSDRKLSVQRAAVVSLGTLRHSCATEALVNLLEDGNLGEDALKSLIRIGAPALLYCCQMLQNDRVEPTEPRFLQGEPRAQANMQGANPLWRQAARPQIIQEANPLRQQTVRRMILQAGDPLLREALTLEDWSGQQRWLILEAVRRVHTNLSFFEALRQTKFTRLSDIPLWCERVSRDPELVALHVGTRQVLDYIMLGRASQRDYATEGTELLRGANGTKERDTGAALLRASDKSNPTSETLTLLGRLRQWLKQEG